jgi:YD repeat-containing protein
MSAYDARSRLIGLVCLSGKTKRFRYSYDAASRMTVGDTPCYR